MRRLLALMVGVSLGAWLFVPAASTARPTADVSHTSTKSASAVLTDCDFGAPPGTECHGILLSINDPMGRDSAPAQTSMTLVAVTITEYGFDFWFTGSGSTSEGTILVAKDLSRAQATADVPIEHCTYPDEGEPVCTTESVLIDVQWTGTGPVSRDRAHGVSKSTSADSRGFFNYRGLYASRVAEVSATIAGAPYRVYADILGPPRLTISKSGAVEKYSYNDFGGALAAAMTPMSVQQNGRQMSYASAGLSDCPAEPVVGDTCTSAWVSAMKSMDGNAVAESRVSADVYSLTLVSEDGEEYYEWTWLYYGQDDAAVIDIDPRLRSARAVAELQTDSDTVAVSVEWTGTGVPSVYRSHSIGSSSGSGDSFWNEHYLDTYRSASVLGVLAGKTLSSDYGYLEVYRWKSVSH